MKTKTIILSVILAVFCAMNLTAQDGKKAKKANTETVCFDVNLHCDNCKKRVEKNISWEKGVKDLQVNLEEKTVTVTFDSRKTTVENLQKAIEKLGYTCTEKSKHGF